MLESGQTFDVNAPIEAVWDYASDMRNWAVHMPGYSSFDVLSDTDSRWTLKIAVGPFKRTVKLLVHITEWNQPDHIAFSLRSETDPVDGTGTFNATSIGENETRVTTSLKLNSSGPMAPMMESMARPVLPRMAQSFAQSLTRDIESRSGS